MTLDRRTLIATASLAAVPVAAAGAPAARPRGWDGFDVPMKRQDGSPMVARILFPVEAARPAPLIAFSHGALSNGGAYDAVLSAWAARGYVIVAPTHQDSETLPPSGLTPPQQRAARVWEIQSMLDAADHIQALLRPRGVVLDPGLRAVAGHSYGAIVAALFGGAVWIGPDGGPLTAKQGQARAIVSLSPPGPTPNTVVGTEYRSLTAPFLMTTGTLDIPPKESQWTTHLTAFEGAQSRVAYALVGQDVDHYLGGLICRFNLDEAPQHEGLDDVRQATGAFLDAMVREDPAAVRKLQAMAMGRGLIRSELRQRG